MAAALLLAGLFMTMGLLRLYPTGGQALALAPVPFVVAWVANFVFGALVTLGIGATDRAWSSSACLGWTPARPSQS